MSESARLDQMRQTRRPGAAPAHTGTEPYSVPTLAQSPQEEAWPRNH